MLETNEGALPATRFHKRPERSDERPRGRETMLTIPDRSDDLLVLKNLFSLLRLVLIRSAAVLLTAPIDSAKTMRLTTRCSGSPSNAVASALNRSRSRRSCGVCVTKLGELQKRKFDRGKDAEVQPGRCTHRLEERVEGAAAPLGVCLVFLVNHRNRQPRIERSAHLGGKCLARRFEERALV